MSAGHVSQEVRYFAEERRFSKGREAIVVCYRRSGVIAGYVIRRIGRRGNAATERYDGNAVLSDALDRGSSFPVACCLYSQSASSVWGHPPPDFGSSSSEQGKYEPGGYTPQARLNMVGGALSIICGGLKQERSIDLVDEVQRDYVTTFYPFIKDQGPRTCRCSSLYGCTEVLGGSGFLSICHCFTCTAPSRTVLERGSSI